MSRNRFLVPFLSLVTAVGAGASPAPPTSPEEDIPDLRLEPVFRGTTFSAPVQMVPVPGDPQLFLVVEQRGRLIAASEDPAVKNRTALDLRDRVRMKHSEEGLLSVTYPPDVAVDPHLYLYYTASAPRRSVLSRMDLAEDGSIDRTSEEILLEIPQPYGNHNGGVVLFGPDGMLYLSIGDGGSANDPHGHGQNGSTLLGTIIRIDVSSTDAPYAIPADNPFVGREGMRDEIWAYGLRNVWRMHFDSETGELWAGDVGQNAWEEIDIIHRGGNYGWRLREGKHDFRADGEPVGTLVEPVIEYPRTAGQSVTGGFVYRGRSIPGLRGAYLFADYMTGRVWGARLREGGQPRVREVLKHQPIAVSSFAEGPDGELYLCGFKMPYARTGKIYRLAAWSVSGD